MCFWLTLTSPPVSFFAATAQMLLFQHLKRLPQKKFLLVFEYVNGD